ncbi:uncharacterized protein LOC128222974 isoform X3 [Mya arenaria]|uniref:uncharacterized protein LOC128222974 isoform X3 n=1 Tax=Mya arenaria TaxID=6604 RepID=UPI0022E6E23E|nr:uncharacterized protein LOC128222974 isoform X3 [Mya arenaria]
MLFVRVLSLFVFSALITKTEQALNCSIPDDPYASYYVNGEAFTGNGTVLHKNKVRVECENGTSLTVRSDVRTCRNGVWKPRKSFPICEPEPCRLNKEKGRRFFLLEKELDGEVGHEEKVNVVCDRNFDQMGNDEDSNSEIHCLKGQFDKMYQCVERCAIPDISNANITRSNGANTDKLKHGENITVTCHKGYSSQSSVEGNDASFTLTCKNGTIGNRTCELSQYRRDQQENVIPTAKSSLSSAAAAAADTTSAIGRQTDTNKTQSRSPVNERVTVPGEPTTSPIDIDHGELNCTIPESTDVKFVTLSGEELKEGAQIHHGRQILAEKECKDYFEGYHLDYDYYGEEISPPTRLLSTIVICTEGVISDYTLDCDDVETSDTPVTIPEECKTVPNGEVTDNGKSFQCNEDYVHADSLLYERYSCSCDRTIPALVCNGRQAKCKPINCKLNSFIEQGMTLKYRSKFITASTIDAIDHGELVMFNCEIGANGVTYEPKRRMFKCDRGKWFEDNRRGSVWSLGNNGTFPKCRPAKCECQNGGTCIRDETCKCSRFTKGLQCETPLCPGQCQNGGSCISPNRCSCPYGFFGSRCETALCDGGCQNGGTCISPNKCSCPDGFSGSRCESALCDGGCQNGGTCISRNRCSCPKGFSGSRCETALCDGGCRNGGTCTSPNRCTCPNGFSGSHCETALCDEECQNGGTCSSPNKCSCSNEFSGIHCETALCGDGCQNAGTCTSPNRCRCLDGFSGSHCQTARCDGGCQNGGTCTSPNKCSCPDGFSGSRCESEEGCQAPIEKGNDALYRNGATYTVSHESCSGGNIPSFKGQITCVNGRWSEQVSCLGGASYRITVKTANIKWSTGEGTDREVYLYMYGSKGNSSKIILHGRFEAGYNDITVGHFVDVGEINKIRIGVKALHSRFAGWKLESVLIEDVSKSAYYKFLHNLSEIFLHRVASCSPPAGLRNVQPFYIVDDTLYLDSSNCAKGYIPNSSSTKCTATGWTINIVCNQIFCSPPAVLRNVHPFYLDGHTLYLDSSNCAKGYIPNSSSTKCTATGWTINVVCNQIFCTPPAGLRNVHLFYLDGHTLYLDSSNCAKGYIPNSSSTKCTATGWTINVVCNQIFCSPPAVLRNVHPFYLDGHTLYLDSSNCAKGYIPNSSSTKCTATGWTINVVCNQIFCTPPAGLRNVHLFYLDGHTLYLDSSNCAKGYIPNSSSTKCTATGWTINVVCNQIFCSPPAVLRNVHPFYLDGHTLYLDSSNCAKGYIPNSSSTKCTATGWTINVVCNQIFCTPPAGLRNVHSFYLDGHTLFLDSSNCAKGYIPNSSSTKCTATGWTINVVCNQRKSTSTYRIRVKTIDYDKDPWGGTRQNVLVKIQGRQAETRWIPIWGDFFPGRISETRFSINTIEQIEKIHLKAYGNVHVGEKWKPDYVTIHVEDTDDLYVFRYKSSEYLFKNETSLYPEGKCSRPFANYRQEIDVYGYYLQRKPAKDEIDCKIQCIEHIQCKMSVYETNSGYCRGYFYGKTRHYSRSTWTAYDLMPCYGRN